MLMHHRLLCVEVLIPWVGCCWSQLSHVCLADPTITTPQGLGSFLPHHRGTLHKLSRLQLQVCHTEGCQGGCGWQGCHTLQVWVRGHGARGSSLVLAMLVLLMFGQVGGVGKGLMAERAHEGFLQRVVHAAVHRQVAGTSERCPTVRTQEGFVSCNPTMHYG